MNLYLIYRICHFYNVRYDKARNNKNLPNFEFKNLDNLTFCKDSLKKKTEIILIYFNTECNHCQEELNQFVKNYKQVKHLNILFISSQKIEELQKFYKQNNLCKYPEINILYCDFQRFQHYFGIATIPTTWIYGDNRELKKKYNGEVSLSIIIHRIESDN